MSGPKKDMIKLSEQGIVTEEALIAYLQNKLSPEEKQQLEKLLQEDPFAHDALEGLQSSMNQATVAASISSLNKKVRERSGLKERKGLQLHWTTYAWGVVIFGLIIGICFLMVNFLNKKSNTTDVTNEKENVTAPAIQPKDTASMSEKPKTIIPDSLAGKVPVTDTASAINKPADANTPKANGAIAPTGSKPATVAPGQKPTETPPAKNAPGPAAPKPKTDSVKTVSKTTQAAKTESKDITTLQNDAMKSFNSGDYTAAGEAFDLILKRDPENADALYFGGISDYINNKTAKSENSFDKLLKKGNKYIDGSKWYKANILIKKGHSEAAKPLLQEISNSNSPYKERAIKKLADMGFL